MKKKILLLVLLICSVIGLTNAQNKIIDGIDDTQWSGWQGHEKEGVLEHSNIPLKWDTIN